MPHLCNQMQPTGSQIHLPAKPNDHPRTKNAPTLTPNSTQYTLMLQCNYGKKILGAGGRGVSL